MAPYQSGSHVRKPDCFTTEGPTMAKSVNPKRKPAGSLTKPQIQQLRSYLEEERRKLLLEAKGTLTASMTQEVDTGRDELDQCNDEALQAYQLRLRDRERGKLHKIEKALDRIASGTYNECEECGGNIGFSRLRARPVATLCINCKEIQEREERETREEDQIPDLMRMQF